MILEKAFIKKQLVSALLFFGAAVLTAVGLHFTVRLLDEGKNQSPKSGLEEGSAEFASYDAEPGTNEKLGTLKGEPWNGGKPHARVDVTSSFRQLSDDAFEFSYEVMPQEPCDEFIVNVRGIDGVRLENEQPTSQSCSQKLSEAIVLQVPPGVSGYVVVDVEMISGSDSRGFSRSFAAVNGVAEPSVSGLGRIEKSNGKPIRGMKIE
jgi:hypothetical protein